MSGEHLSRYSERLNLVEYRERIQRRRKEQSHQSNSVPPKYRTVNNNPIIDNYSNSSMNVPDVHIREAHSSNRLNLNEVQLSLNMLQLDPADRTVLRVADERDAMQKKTFEKWINCHMSKYNFQIQDIFQDLRDGTVLLSLLKLLSGENLAVQRGFSRFHYLENINTVLRFLREQNIRLVNIHADDLVDGNPKLTLGLVWVIILFYQFKEIVQSNQSENLSVGQILLQWSRKSLEDYPDINIKDFSSSWKDGKAFLALIHKHRPNLIDYKSSLTNSAEENLDMAFNTAEKNLGIPKILDTKDVLRGDSDEKSMMTYVASLYDLQRDTNKSPTSFTEKCNAFENLYFELEKYLKMNPYDTNASATDIFLHRHNSMSELYNEFLSTYDEVSRSMEPVPIDFPKKYDSICNEWLKFDTNLKERSLMQSSENKRYQRSIMISSKLEQDHKEMTRSIEKLKQEMRQIPSRVKIEPPSIISQDLNTIEKNLSHFENQISSMLLTVQDLRRDNYPNADTLYRKVVNLESIVGNIKHEYETISNIVPRSTSLGTESFGTVGSLNFPDDSRSFTNLNKCLSNMEQRQRLLAEIEFGSDLKELEKNYKKFKELFDDLKNYEHSLDDILSVRVSKRDTEIFESKRKEVRRKFDDIINFCFHRETDFVSYNEFLVQANRTIEWMKEKENEQIKWQWFDNESIKLSEKQEKFKNLIDELEMKESSVNETIAVGTTLSMNGHAAGHYIQRTLCAMNCDWQWILNLTHCLKTHLENLAIYEQFFHEACEADNVILDYTKQLNARYFRPMGVQLDEGELLNREIRDMLGLIEEIKEQVDRLIYVSQNVIALSLRTSPVVPNNDIIARAICSSKELPDSPIKAFNEGDNLRLVSNISSEIWKLENKKRDTISAPAICFVITNTSPQATLTASTLNNHWTYLRQLWNERELHLREQVLYATMNIVKNWTPDDFRALDQINRQKVIEILNDDASRLIMDLKCFNTSNSAIAKFQSELNLCNVRFSDLAHDIMMTDDNDRSPDRNVAFQVIDQDAINSARLQIDDLTKIFQKMQNHLRMKLKNQVVLQIAVLENQVADHKEFETNLKNYETQVNDIIAIVKQGSGDSLFLKPKLEEMIELWEALWHEAHLFVVRLKTTELFFSQFEDIDQVIYETESTLANQIDSFPAGSDQIKILTAQLEAAQDDVTAAADNMRSCPQNLNQLIDAVSAGRRFQKEVNYYDLQQLKKDLQALENRYQMLQNQIAKRLNLVKECSNQYLALKNDLRPITTWMVSLQTRIKTQISNQNMMGSSSYEESATKICSFIGEMSNAHSDIEEINKSATYFLNLIKKFENLVKSYQNEADLSLTNQDYYGYNKRSRIQNARDWVGNEISKLNNDFNQTSEQLHRKLAGYREMLLKTGYPVFGMPDKLDMVDSFKDYSAESNKLKLEEKEGKQICVPLPVVRRPTQKDEWKVISNLTRSQLTNLWYYSSMISENFAPISIGDCFRYHLIKSESTYTGNNNSEQPMSLEDALNEGNISRKTFDILTAKRDLSGRMPISIMDMVETSIFDIYNGTITVQPSADPISLSNATSSKLISAQMSDYLNCLMISSLHVVHEQPQIVSATYSLNEFPKEPSMISLSDSVDLNLFNMHSNKFINPFTRTDMSYTLAIQANLVNQNIPEIVVTNSRNVTMFLTGLEAANDSIFRPDSGCLINESYSDDIPLPFARMDGMLNKWTTLLGMILEKSELPVPISEALERRMISNECEFVITGDQLERQVSLGDAVKSQMVTEKGLLNIDSETGGVTFAEALKRGLISVLETAVSSQTLEILHPSLNSKLSLLEAINLGIIDTTSETYFNASSNERCSLKEAVSRQFISGKMYTNLSVYCGIRNGSNRMLNVIQAIDQHLLDCQNGLIKDLHTDRWNSVTDLFENGLLTRSQYNRLVFLTCPLIKYRIKIKDVVANIDETEFQREVTKETFHSISGVYDSSDDQYVDLRRAVDMGIVSRELGLYFHRKDDISFTIPDAIDSSFVKVGNVSATERILQIKAIKSEKTRSYLIESVFNSLTKSWVASNRAIEDGIIDDLSGRYMLINDEGEEKSMSIEEAISAGYIRATYDEDECVAEEYSIIGFKNPATGETVSPDVAIATGLVDRSLQTFYDPITRSAMPMQEAHQCGYVVAGTDQKSVVTLNYIVTNDLIDCDTGIVTLPGNEKPLTLHEAIARGLVDSEKSMIKHPDTGVHVSLKDAIRSGLFDPVKCEMKDECDNIITLTDAIQEALFPEHMRTEASKITFEEALEQSYIDMRKNIFTDPRTNLCHSVDDAIQNNLLDHPQSNLNVVLIDRLKKKEIKTLELINAPDLVDTSQMSTTESIQRSYNSGKVDYQSVKSVRDVTADQEISLISAINRGIIRMDDELFVDNQSGVSMPIGVAMKRGLITSLTGHGEDSTNNNDFSIIDPNSGRKLTKEQATRENIFDPVNNMIISLNNNNYYTIEDGLKMGIVVPALASETPIEESIIQRNCVIENFYYVHKGVDVTAKITNQMLSADQIDIANRTVKDPQTGQLTSLAQGLENGFVFATILTLTNRSVYFEILNKRHDNYQIISVYDPTLNQLLSYDDALNKKIINLVDSTYTNSKTKEISTLTDALQHGLIHAVMKTRQYVPLSHPFTNVHIRTIEEEMNFSIPQNLPDDMLSSTGKPKSRDYKPLEEINDVIMASTMRKEDVGLPLLCGDLSNICSNEVPMVAEKYLEALQIESDKLSTVENKLIENFAVSLNEKENQILHDQCQDISADFSSKQESILSLVHQVEKLLAKKYDNIPGHVGDQLQEMSGDLKVRTNQLQREINSRLRQLITIFDESDQFINKLNDCKQCHDKLSKSLDMIGRVEVYQDLTRAIIDTKSMESDFGGYQNDIRVLNNSRLKLIDKIHKFDESKKKFCHLLSVKENENEDAGTLEKINTNADEVVEQQRQIYSKHKSQLLLLSNVSERIEHLTEKQTQIDNILSETDFTLSSIELDKTTPSSHTDQLHRINGELSALSRIVKSLEDSRIEVPPVMSSIGMKQSSIDALMNTVDATITNYSSTANRVKDLLKDVNNQSLSLNEAAYSIINLEHWLTDIGHRIDVIGPFSLDLHRLNEQDRLLQTIVAEISGRLPSLENLLTIVNGDKTHKIQSLKNRMDASVQTCSKMTADISSIRSSLDTCNELMKSNCDWMSSTIELLSERHFIKMDEDKIRERLDEVKAALQMKDKNIHEANLIIDALLKKGNCCDQKSIENAAENVQKIRSSLENLLKSRTEELQYRQECGGKYSSLKNQLLEAVNGWEHVLNTVPQLAVDLPKLENQEEEVNTFLKDWSSKKADITEFCQIGLAYDLILQGFPPGSVGVDQQYKITSPIRRSFKVKSNTGNQTQGASVSAKVTTDPRTDPCSGSESSGVSSADFVNLNQELNEVVLEMDDIKSRYSEIGDRFTSRRVDVQSLIKKCKVFDVDYAECSEKLNSILSNLFPDDQLQENVDFEKIGESMKVIKPDLERTLSLGNDLLRHREFVSGGVELKSKLKELERKYQSLETSSKNQIDIQRNVDNQKIRFNDMKKVLESSIMRKERMLNVLGPVGTSVTYANAQLEQVNALVEEIEGIENDVKELTKVGRDIIRSVSPSSSEAEDIESTLTTFNRKVNSLSDSLKKREANINAIIGPSKDFYKLISSIDDGLSVLQETIDKYPVVGDLSSNINLEVAQTELNSIKNQLADAESLSRTLLNSTSDETAHYDIKNKVGNLSRHCREIQSKIDQNISEKDRRNVQEDQILRKLEEAQKWIEDRENLTSSSNSLIDNIKQLKTLQGDLQHKRSQINDLTNEMDRLSLNKSPTLKSKRIQDHLSNLLPAIDRMESNINGMCKDYQEASTNSDKINNDVLKIEGWIDLEKHKMDRQYPVGIEAFSIQERALEQTLESIDNKRRQLVDLGGMIKLGDNVDSTVLLAPNLTLINEIESNLADLERDVTDKLKSIKESHDKISVVSDNLSDLTSNLTTLDDKWKDMLLNLNNFASKPYDIGKLEKEVLTIQKEIERAKPDLSTIKCHISSVKETSPVNAQLLEPEWKKANDQYLALHAAVAQKLLELKSKQKVADDSKIRVEILSTRQKNLKEKIVNFPQPCLDLDSLEDQIQDMSTLLREAHDTENIIQSLRADMKGLANDGCIESSNILGQKLDSIQTANDEIKDSIEDRHNSLRLQHDLVTDFESKKKELSRKLDDVTNGVDLSKLASTTRRSSMTANNDVRLFVIQRLEPLKRELEQVVRIGDQACSTVMPGLADKHIEQETEQVKHGYDKLLQIVSDIENNVDRNMMKEHNFDLSVDNLNEFIENLRNDIMGQEEPSIEYHKCKSQLNSHRLFLERLKKRRSSFDELNKIGADLLLITDEPRKSVIESLLTNLNKEYDTLMDVANEKNSRFEKAVKLSKAFKDLYEPSLAWLDSAERDLANLDTSPTTDASEIEFRINEYQALVQEMKSHEQTLGNLEKVAQDLISCSADTDAAAIRKRVEIVHGYFEEINDAAKLKMDLFKSSVPVAERFLLANNKLDLVLPSLTALVRESYSVPTAISERNMDIIENEANAVEKLVLQARCDLDQLKMTDAFEKSLEKVEDMFLENERSFREVQEEVIKRATLVGSNRTKAKILEDKLEISQDTITEYQSKVQELNDKMNGDLSDFDRTKCQLNDLLPQWNTKKDEVGDILNESRKLIRQSPGTDLKSLQLRWDDVNKGSQNISKTVDILQVKLDEIIPLANEFTNNLTEISDWLRETEDHMYENKINNLDPDQLHNAQYEIKKLANSWEDQKPTLDKIIKAGQPLIQLVSVSQGKNISAKIEDTKKRYNNVKDFIKIRVADIEDIIQMNTELNDRVDQCANQLDNIRDRVTDCYQPSVHPEKLEEELAIFDEIVTDLEKLRGFAAKLQSSIENCSPAKETTNSTKDSTEILKKLENILKSTEELQRDAEDYRSKTVQLLDLANHFWIGIGLVDQTLSRLNNEIKTIATDDLSDEQTINKESQISDLRKEIERCELELGGLLEKGSLLMKRVENANELPDVEQVEEDIKTNLENVKSNFEQQIASIDNQKALIEKIETMRLELDSWFEVQNERLLSLGPLPTETRPVLNQIEQTKELKTEIEPKHREIEQINQLSYQLTQKSHPNIKKQVNSTMERINESWERLLDSIGQRQHQLQCILLSLGEFHRAVDELMEWIINTENSLSNIKVEYGNVSGLELGLAQHKMIRANMNIQQSSCNNIERKAAEIIKDDVAHLGHEATERLATLNMHWEALKESIRNKHFELEDALKESLIYYGDHQEILRNIDDMASKLDKFKFFGGLPDTAKEQLKRFLEIYKTVPAIENKIERLHADSKELADKAAATVRQSMEQDVAMMDKKWSSIKSQAESRKARFEKAIETVESFHSDMAKFINWLTLTEKNLNQQRPISRIVPIIVDQIDAHRAIKRDITSHREELLNLDKVATHLKYLSQKHDIVLIRNLMNSIHHRWEKVVSRSSERSRNLDYAYKETKRFEDMNRSLLDTIGENMALLEQDTVIGQSPEVIREQIVKHKEVQCRLGVYILSYDETRRFGNQLRDKAPAMDRIKIDETIHNLQNKWQNLFSKSVERERTLNDALLLSGHYKDALENLLTWLRNIEPRFKDTTKGCTGDINTIKILLAEHTNFEKELKSREKMVDKIKKDANQLMMQSVDDTSSIEDQLTELYSLWSNISSLSATKRQNLEDAETQALEFESQWSALKDLLAKSEHGLRQFVLSTDEDNSDVISNMISSSKKFNNDLLTNDVKVNDFQQLGHEILSNAHPDAEGPVKHYINIIKTQWSELLSWSDQRHRNLQDQLDKLHKCKILLDELLLWLATAEGTLVASEHRELPYTMTEAKFQYEEHERFIADMTEKQKDHDDIVTNAKKKSQLPLPTVDKIRRKEFGSNQNLSKEMVFINPKINQLHSKWKQVWFMILNRRKKLLDHIQYLKEVDNMKTFSFDDWRRRYMSWMNHSKSRMMDLFRRQDTDHDGRITRKEFIDGIIESKFPTTRVEMEVVADIFDKQKTGFIDYRQFLAALHPERENYQSKGVSENELIHDEVKKQVSKCCCPNSYKITQCGDGKFRFGENQKLRLVRILRSTVMVRIGGGWSALDEFLVKHDPCRETFVPEPAYTSQVKKNSKGRTNYELREKLSMPKGGVNTMAPFKFKSSVAVPAPAPATKKPAGSKQPSPKAAPSIVSPTRTPAAIVSPSSHPRSRIPTRHTSQQGSRTSTRPQSPEHGDPIP